MDEVEARVKRLQEAIAKLSVVIAYRSDESVQSAIVYLVGWSYLDPLLSQWQNFKVTELVNYRKLLNQEYQYMIDRYYFIYN